MATLEQYNNWRNRLTNLIDQTVAATEKIAPEKAELYKTIGKQLREDTLKVQVVGTVKNGKSSFANALIGENILPVDDLPCTAISSEVKYGPEKKAFVSFYSPLPTGLLDEIPRETANYLKLHNLGKDSKGMDIPIPPLEVPYGHMSDYVTIPEPPLDIMMDEIANNMFQEKIAQETPYDASSLYYPAELLKGGVMLVDSPGLNEHYKRTAVTLDYLKKADAVIYLLNATTPATEEEKKVIEQILMPLGFKDIIMVGNKIDQIKNREKQIYYMQSRVQQYTSIKKCFGVSAKEYLDGKEKGDTDLISQSGIPEFKEFLISYLTKKKGDLKIKKTALQIANSIKSDFLESLIPTRLNALQENALSLQQKVNEATPKLAEVKARRASLANNFDKNIPLALIPVKAALDGFFTKLEKQIPSWIEAYVPKHDCGLYANREDLDIVFKEIIEEIQKKVGTEYQKWNNETLQPILNEQSDFVFGDVKEQVTLIAEDIAGIDGIFNSVKGNELSSTNVLERMAGIAAMAFLPMGRTGGDLFAGGFEIGKFLKNFMVDLGVGLGVGLVALWVWPPLGFIAAAIGALIGLAQGTSRRIKKLKAKISNKIVGDLRNSKPERIAKFQNDIRDMFEKVKKSLLEGVDSEIATTQHQLDELVRITAIDQGVIEEDKQKLRNLKDTFVNIISEIDGLTSEVKESNKE